jgi:hypothetical protein
VKIYAADFWEKVREEFYMKRVKRLLVLITVSMTVLACTTPASGGVL